MSSKKTKQSSNQRSLREFFTQQQQPFHIVLPDIKGTKSSVSVNSVLDGASSDEDELVAMDQLLKPQEQAHKDILGSTRSRHSYTSANIRDLASDSSELPELPTYAGTFSLSALLADRAVRVQDKDKMAKLVDLGTMKTEVEEAGGASLTEKSQVDAKELGQAGELLNARREERKQLKWHYIGRSNHQSLPRSDLAQLADRMPSPFNRCTAEEFRDQIHSGILCQYMQMQGIEALPHELISYLFDELASAGTQHITRITQSLQVLARSRKTQCIDDQLISRIFHSLGARSDVSRDPEGQIENVSRDSNVLFKLREVLGILIMSMESGTYKFDTTGSHSTLIILLQLVLDARYSYPLVAELERALHLYISASDFSSFPINWTALVCITKDPYFQFALLRALPTSSPTGISMTQHLATHFFLHNNHDTDDRNDDGDDDDNHSADNQSPSLTTLASISASRVSQLTRCLHKLQSRLPFHPLNDTTSYSSLAIHFKILGYALLVTEGVSQIASGKHRADARSIKDTHVETRTRTRTSTRSSSVTGTNTRTNTGTDTRTDTGTGTDTRTDTGTERERERERERKAGRDAEEAVVKDIMTTLYRIHGRIVDGKAAFIERSEAKGAIQRLADRVRYTLVADAARKSDVFDQFRT